MSRASGAAGEKGNAGSAGASISAERLRRGARELPADLAAGTRTLASRASGRRGRRLFAEHAALSRDGRSVAFDSLVDPFARDVIDVLVRDLWRYTTVLVSRAAGARGEKANGDSQLPAISGDGGLVAFDSRASNLHRADKDGGHDVFAREVPARPARCKGKPVTIEGSKRRDKLTGTDGRDVIATFGGKDRVSAKRGRDIVCLGRGADVARGGGGRDKLRGAKGNDRLSGGPGKRDVLRGQAGRDRLSGGKGKRDVCHGGRGRDGRKTKGCERVRRIP